MSFIYNPTERNCSDPDSGITISLGGGRAVPDREMQSFIAATDEWEIEVRYSYQMIGVHTTFVKRKDESGMFDTNILLDRDARIYLHYDGDVKIRKGQPKATASIFDKIEDGISCIYQTHYGTDFNVTFR